MLHIKIANTPSGHLCVISEWTEAARVVEVIKSVLWFARYLANTTERHTWELEEVKPDETSDRTRCISTCSQMLTSKESRTKNDEVKKSREKLVSFSSNSSHIVGATYSLNGLSHSQHAAFLLTLTGKHLQSCRMLLCNKLGVQL